MNKIEVIEKKLAEAYDMLNVHQSILQEDFSNLAYKLGLSTVENHIADLQNQLRIEKEFRDKEILKFELKGAIAEEGSIPLMILSELSHYLSKAILSASQSLKYGEKAKGKIPNDILQTVDLRFAGISAGSTCIYITGKTSPDLFGRSLLEASLYNTFSLLESQKPDELSEVVSKIGIRSTKNINELLKLLSSSKLDMRISWNSPTEEIYEWKGDKYKMLILSNSLESIKSEKPELLGFEGELVMASTKGQFEILDKEKKVYRGEFPQDLLEDVKALHIGQYCTGRIERRTLINQVTGYRKIYYTLKKIKPKI